MENPQPAHSSSVQSLLAKLSDDRAAILTLCKDIAGNGKMFELDFLAFAAAKRAICAASAFQAVIETWNMSSARTMLRSHIDTALRFSAAWMVDEPHKFAADVIAGGRIDKMKDRNGFHFRDAYLIKVHTEAYPWLPTVYTNLSGYIHFSSAHVRDLIEVVDDENERVSFLISDADRKFPESSWIEMLECFRETSAMLAEFLQGYAMTKNLTPAELEEGRKKLVQK
jgi:hypothetical protein